MKQSKQSKNNQSKNKHSKNKQISPDQERAAKLASMGAELRRLRLEQSRTLQEISAETMIRSSQLEAIEEGRLEKLPEPIYVRGFLLRFANALGLDGYAFSSDFPIDKEKKRDRKRFYWGDLLALFQLRSIHLYILYVLLIIFSVRGLSQHLSRAGVQTNNLETSREPTAIPPQKKEPPRREELALTPRANAATAKPVRVGLTLKETSWVRIVADGKTEFEGTLLPGTQRTWEADRQLVVRAGNAGGVLVKVNNGQAKQMGDPDTVEEITITASNPRS
ncbi:MAG: helix-turn-helix domain-containing protein [Oscillatoria sp. SIO1A7]|nr:helix-turn-helix domain-containing protein [Oscillatoria sp. SIO1A7]